jgi:DNA-binding NarL/FixJ family response regulator
MSEGGRKRTGRVQEGSDKGQAGNARRWRIVLTEDDAVVRDRLVRLIADWGGAELVAVCGDLAQTLAALGQHEIDLLITDLRLPDGSGNDAIRALKDKQPGAEAMVISVLADDKTVLESIEVGASGYLLKDADAIDLVEAIGDLMAGYSPISSRIARVLVKRLSDRTEAPAEGVVQPTLTAREMDILWGIAKGFTYGELAERLGISKQTVPVHIRNIYRKLQASNRSEAVFEATRLGLIKL